MDVDITEVARRSGVPASTLRFYEEKGLISSIGRRGLRRIFDPGVLERLALVALGRADGFSLDETAGVLASQGRPHINRQTLLAKAEELDKTIRNPTQTSAMVTALRNRVCRRLSVPPPEFSAAIHSFAHDPQQLVPVPRLLSALAAACSSRFSKDPRQPGDNAGMRRALRASSRFSGSKYKR